MLGHTFAHRIFVQMARDFAFSPFLLRHLLIMNLSLIAFFALISDSAMMLWLFIGILLITLKFFPMILRIFLLKRLRDILVPFLDSIILGLQTGKSFRSAFHASIEMQSGWIRHQFMEIYDSMVMSENVIAMKSALLADLQKEFIEIDRSKSRCVDQLRALRKDIKMLEDFRRRSGQVTQQLKMQAIIVTALFVALLVFVIKQFGFQAQKNLIFGASIVFIFGLLTVFLMGRRFKWKV
jgi:hypothetical protein